jgi:hypothetical protein
MAVFRQTVGQGSGQMVVFQKGGPSAEAWIRGDQRRFPLVPFLHEREKEADLYWIHLHVAQLVYGKAVQGFEAFYLLRLAVVGEGLV